MLKFTHLAIHWDSLHELILLLSELFKGGVILTVYNQFRLIISREEFVGEGVFEVLLLCSSIGFDKFVFMRSIKCSGKDMPCMKNFTVRGFDDKRSNLVL
jgi:hypothetical protein